MEAGRQPVATWETKNQAEHVDSWSHDVTSRPRPAFHLSFCGNWARSLRKNIGNDSQLWLMSGYTAGTFGPPCINSINDLLISLPCSVLCPGKPDLHLSWNSSSCFSIIARTRVQSVKVGTGMSNSRHAGKIWQIYTCRPILIKHKMRAKFGSQASSLTCLLRATCSNCLILMDDIKPLRVSARH